jgi:hypothetical protein
MMAIHFATSTARALLIKFDSEINQKEPTGKIRTWEKHPDGVHYTHKASEWKNKAFFRPTIESNQLTFNIVAPKDEIVTSLVYAYYHGHLIETFLTHFDQDFKNSTASSLPEQGDLLK